MSNDPILPKPIHGLAMHPGTVRKQQEDACDYFEVDANPGAVYIAVVADGVTSNAGGERASELAIRTIKEQLEAAGAKINDQTSLRSAIHDAIIAANQAILTQTQHHPKWGNMSTTLVLTAVYKGQLTVAHLGDSRAYLIRDGQIYRLTLDHNWIQQALDAGRLTLEEARTHPNRHVIMRYLGINPKIEIDFEIIEPALKSTAADERKIVNSLAIQPGDTLLLCTDGLTEKVNDEDIQEIVTRHETHPKQAVELLINAAVARKEQDNITALVVHFGHKTGYNRLKGWGINFGRRRLGCIPIGFLIILLLIIADLLIIIGPWHSQPIALLPSPTPDLVVPVDTITPTATWPMTSTPTPSATTSVVTGQTPLSPVMHTATPTVTPYERAVTPGSTVSPDISATIPTLEFVESEYPDELKRNETGFIRITLLRTNQDTYQAKLEMTDNVAAVATLEPIGTPQVLLKESFGPSNQVWASARLSGSAFEIESPSKEVQLFSESAVDWRWTIKPKDVGAQLLIASVSIQWTPGITASVSMTPPNNTVSHEIWRDIFSIEVVDEHSIVEGRRASIMAPSNETKYFSLVDTDDSGYLGIRVVMFALLILLDVLMFVIVIFTWVFLFQKRLLFGHKHMSSTATGGGAHIAGDVSAGGSFVGRDSNNITINYHKE